MRSDRTGQRKAAWTWSRSLPHSRCVPRLAGIGLAHHAPLFEAAEVDAATLPHLDEGDLRELGLGSPRDRCSVLVAARRLTSVGPRDASGSRALVGAAAAAAVAAVASPPRAAPRAPSSLFSSLFNLRPADVGKGRITSFFPTAASLQQQQPASSLVHAGDGRLAPRAQPADPASTSQAPFGPVSTALVPQNQMPVLAENGPSAPRRPDTTGLAPKPEMRPIGVRPPSWTWGSVAGAAAAAVGIRLPAFGAHRTAVQSAGGGEAGPSVQPGRSLAGAPAVASSSSAALLAAAAAAGPPQGIALSRGVPRWQTIPGTRFLVDLFSTGSRDIEGCRYWFLTHFHSDHYQVWRHGEN